MTTTSRVTVFHFAHQALRLPNAYFTLLPPHQVPVYKVDMGEMRGTVPLDGLKSMFDIDDASPDGLLLATVNASLRFVRVIRHGDAVPNEILNGTASWPIEEHHRQRAEARIIASVLAALTGGGGAAVDAAQLTALAVDDNTRLMVRERATDMARLISLPPERASEVLDRIEMLAGELGFIEALRDWFRAAFDLRQKLARVARRIRDRDAIQEVKRVTQLLKDPLTALERSFDEVDAQTGEAVPALRSLDKVVQLVRRRRDELHFASMDWEAPLQGWRDMDPDHGNPSPAIKTLYRFLAQRNLSAQVWVGPG